jgi:hypothetical protein
VHQVDCIVACSRNKSIGPVNACFFKRGFIRSIAGNCQDIVVLKDLAAPGFLVVDHHNVVAVFDRLFDKAASDAAEPHDDNIHVYRLPSSPLK